MLPFKSAETREGTYPFSYSTAQEEGKPVYKVSVCMAREDLAKLRHAATAAAESLDPRDVDPITFTRLVQVLEQLAAGSLSTRGEASWKARRLSEVAAYEAIGLGRILALASDQNVTEYFVDSDSSPVYVDHAVEGRCETEIFFTERERHALATHLDTFGGYTADFRTPSLKNDLTVSDATLRISLDLDPLAVNRFSLDVRRLNTTSLDIARLIKLNVISLEAASFLVSWLECGGNVTIVGETGTGKTTLLNALDEELDPRLRRLYIEDSVETRDLVPRGYHQMKVKVDPLDRGEGPWRTKGMEIVKALHRSPDLVILSEIQSEEHSRAFFHSLSAGVRGMQTFHASSVEQAIGRWLNIHGIPPQSLLELGLFVQMWRPDRLKQERYVQRVCCLDSEEEVPRVKDIFARDSEFNLTSLSNPFSSSVSLPAHKGSFISRSRMAEDRISQRVAQVR